MRRNFIGPSLPTAGLRGEYFGASVHAVAALDNIALTHAHEAIDELRERCPQLIKGEVRRLLGRLEGNGQGMGLLRRLEIYIGDTFRLEEQKAWMADFGNAAYSLALPHIERLQFAIGNNFGRHGVPDITAFSKVIVAQSLAGEAAASCERRQAGSRGLTVRNWRGERMECTFMLSLLSCRPIERTLTQLAKALVEPNSTGDIDLFTDKAITDGCKAVVNVMSSVETWAYARDKADELAVKNQK